MIKITKKDRPDELTYEVQKKLTDQYKENTKRAVWKKTYIIESLLQSSHRKCCYCECRLNVAGNYMEVEHFKPKSIFPDLVVDWDNLLPSCKRCNGNKSSFDTNKKPIIDPSKIDPGDHLRMMSYRLRPRKGSEIGKTTIDLLLLNDSDKLVYPRFEIGEKTHETILTILNEASVYDESTPKSIRRKNRIITSTRKILIEGAPKAEYAATVASELIRSDDFKELKEILEKNELWNNDLRELYESVKHISLSD